MAKQRFTLDVTPELAQVMEKLAADYGTTKGEVFRRAIGLLNAAHDAKKHNLHVGAVEESERDRMKREFVGL